MLCYICGIYSGFCCGKISYAVMHVIYLRFLLRPGLKPVYFLPPKMLSNYFIIEKTENKSLVEKFTFNVFLVVAASELASTLFEQVVVLVLHAEVCLIPPRGLPTCGPPKSCRPKQRLAPHSSLCKFHVEQNDWQVCLIPTTSVSRAAKMTTCKPHLRLVNLE